MIDWTKHAREFYGEFQQPHPDGKGDLDIKVKDYMTAIKLTNKTRGGGHAEPEEINAFWSEFQGLGISPAHYEEVIDSLGKLSHRYHERPPTMREVALLKDLKPAEQRRHYADLPHKNYPEMSAHEYLVGHVKAAAYSQHHLGRDPYGHEVQMFHHHQAPGAEVGGFYENLGKDHEEKSSRIQ